MNAPVQPQASKASANLLLLRAQNATPEEGVRLRIAAAKALLEQNNFTAVLNALAPLDSESLPTSDLDQLANLRAEALFDLGRFVEADGYLRTASNLNGPGHLLLANICSRLADYTCAADNYITASLSTNLTAHELPADINELIWRALSRAPAPPEFFIDPEHRAWWNLRDQLSTADSISKQRSSWAQWKSQHPEHPAQLSPPASLRRLESYKAPQIAVLLPLSGPYAEAAKSVRDGLIAAYMTERPSDQPQVKLYDTGSASISELYGQALEAGAEVFVGPLIKDEVEAFVELSANSEIPRLVLNYLSTDETPSLNPSKKRQKAGVKTTPLYQFGIAIEDEALSLSNYILASGVTNLLLVHSDTRWSQRALAAFQSAWPYPLTIAPFGTVKDLTGAVGEAMQVEASETRKKDLSRIIGEPVEFLARARQDLDAVVALTNQLEAQALLPALRFHFAGELPVYATSQASIGNALAELAGIHMTEMPINAHPTPEQRQLQLAFDLQSDPLIELYALGFDAYRLANWLPVWSPDHEITVPAAAGVLQLEGPGAFRRVLSLSQINHRGRRTSNK